MGAIVEFAEEAGIFLHGIRSPFFLKWPDIDTVYQFLWFIKNEKISWKTEELEGTEEPKPVTTEKIRGVWIL
ncbi:MAG: hypothetical protein GY751_18170 [Bacteroidetes bacterium]|nr:hypothetical protein [Bacteroidota bacterium]